jgi:hypothetical protein
LLHGWLSAVAFVALCFFAFTGLLLNHPEWLADGVPDAIAESYTLTEGEIAQLRAAPDGATALVEMVATRIDLKGELAGEDAEGALVGNELFVRLRGVRGSSFLRANLATGALEVTVEPEAALTMLNELHRAERAGAGWRLAVDAIAVLLIALSLIGYLIFLSMRGTRLRSAIVLTIASTFGLYLVFALAVS